MSTQKDSVTVLKNSPKKLSGSVSRSYQRNENHVDMDLHQTARPQSWWHIASEHDECFKSLSIISEISRFMALSCILNTRSTDIQQN